MLSNYKVDAEPNPNATGTTPNGKSYVRLHYYMQELAEQKHWRAIPGAVVADTADEAMANAKALSDQLDGLTIKEMSQKVRDLIREGKMVANFRHERSYR